MFVAWNKCHATSDNRGQDNRGQPLSKTRLSPVRTEFSVGHKSFLHNGLMQSQHESIQRVAPPAGSRVAPPAGWVPLRADLDKILGLQNTTCSATDGDVRHRAVLPATGSAPALPARSGHPFPGRPVRPWGVFFLSPGSKYLIFVNPYCRTTCGGMAANRAFFSEISSHTFVAWGEGEVQR